MVGLTCSVRRGKSINSLVVERLPLFSECAFRLMSSKGRKQNQKLFSKNYEYDDPPRSYPVAGSRECWIRESQPYLCSICCRGPRSRGSSQYYVLQRKGPARSRDRRQDGCASRAYYPRPSQCLPLSNRLTRAILQRSIAHFIGKSDLPRTNHRIVTVGSIRRFLFCLRKSSTSV